LVRITLGVLRNRDSYSTEAEEKPGDAHTAVADLIWTFRKQRERRGKGRYWRWKKISTTAVFFVTRIVASKKNESFFFDLREKKLKIC